MSFHDDVYREAISDWLDERPAPDLPSPSDLTDDDDRVPVAECGTCHGNGYTTVRAANSIRLHVMDPRVDVEEVPCPDCSPEE